MTKYITLFLQIVSVVGWVAIVFVIISFSNNLSENTRQAKATATSTNNIVQSQNDILNAIKQLATDTKITSDEKTSIIICMLQVPVSERTTDVETNCRRKAQIQSSTTPPTTSQNSTFHPQTNTQAGSTGGGGQPSKEPDPPKPPEPPNEEGILPDWIPLVGGLL